MFAETSVAESMMAPRCGECNGCLNHLDGFTCDKCKFCLDSSRLGGPFRLRQICVYKWCVLNGKGKKDVERKGVGDGGEGRAGRGGGVRKGKAVVGSSRIYIRYCHEMRVTEGL